MYSETFDIMHWIFGTKAAGGRELAPRSPSRTMTLWMEDDTGTRDQETMGGGAAVVAY